MAWNSIPNCAMSVLRCNVRYREETVPQIEKLRYVRLGVKDTVAATEFARRVVGLQQIEAPDGLAMFRSDNRDHSLVIARADEDEESEALAIQLRTPEDLVTVCDLCGYC